MDEKALCPRLIDFVVLVGRRANSRLQPHGAPYFLRGGDGGARLRRQLAATGGIARPEILRCYPSENHRDFELPTDVTYFCQPEGCVTIGTSQKRWNIARDTTLFVFTLTEKDSAKIRYGISLNFFLNCERNDNNGGSRGVCKPDSGDAPPAAGVPSAARQEPKRKTTSCGSSSLISLCLISHHPFLSTFRDLLILLRQLIDSCNFRCNRDPTLPKDAVWSVLMGHWSGRGPVPERVMDEIRQIETWILMLLSSPVPVPGKTKVVIEVLPTAVMPTLEFALPDHTRFSLVDFPLHLPIELLGVDVVVRLLAAVMLEHKVILQSRNYNAVSMCVMALVALMYPLEYMFPVIPLLPVFMPSSEQLLLAPTPYIIGVPASFFTVKNIGLPPDVLLVDLDTNELTISPDLVNMHQFPEPECTNLKEAFRKALGKVRDDVPAPARTVTSDSLANLSQSSTSFQIPASGQLLEEIEVADEATENGVAGSSQISRAVVSHNEISGGGAFESGYAVDNDEIDVAVRVAMVQFYDSPNIFANFSEHARTLRLYPRPVVALQTDSFLRSRPVHNEFIAELCRTQSVEYFAEISLCPRNETYVRIQTGVKSPAEIGDKAKWFSDQLMPIHFNAYPNNVTLADSLLQMRAERPTNLLSDSDDEDTSDLESSYSGGMEESLYSDSSFESRSPTNFERYKPLSDMAVDYYNAPKHLKLPQSHSGLSISSSVSSGRSSPASSMSMAASVVDSEADFMRLAENLAIKSDSRGDFTFDHSATDEEFPPLSAPVNPTEQPPFKRSSISSTSSSPIIRGATPFKAFKGLQHALANSAASSLSSLTAAGNDAKKVPQIMGALNGYAEKSQGMLSQMFRKTAPKAQAIRDKAVRPLAEAAATRVEHSQHLIQQKKAIQRAPKSSTATANQQRKEQQTISEICEQILSGQSIGVFTYPKVKRLLEDENLRELACSKLNLNLECSFTEDDFESEVQLTRAQYKGYLKLLIACVNGLEQSFHAPGSGGLASMFHVLEIASTHFWTENDGTVGNNGANGADTPGSGGPVSMINSPMGSSHNLSTFATGSQPEELISQPIAPAVLPPPLPPPPQPASARGIPHSIPPPPPPKIVPPSLPQRAPPLPPRQKTPSENSKTSHQTSDPTPANSETAKVANGTAKVQSLQQPAAKVADAPLPPTITSRASTSSAGGEPPRHYLYDDLLTACSKAELWQNLTFWENVFVDMVAQEREIIGMDQEPAEMIDRYAGLSDSEKKRLELDEDRILATLLHNLTAYMTVSRVPERSLQQKVRRLLGKAHIGLVYSKKINQLLDDMPNYPNGRIPLKIVGSRLMQKQSFTVHNGSADGATLFLEICDDVMVLRDMNGVISERWWYERLVNMTYSPKTKMLCLWRRQDDHVHMHKFYTKKCRHLYNCMKAAMERAASRGKVTIAGRDLGGEFPIHDIEHNEGGLLQVRIDGISLLFANRQEFIELANIKKCNTFGGNVFVLEELISDRSQSQLIQRRYVSTMAREIAWSLHRIFSVKLTLGECPKRDAHDEKHVVIHRTSCVSESRIILPLAVPKPTSQPTRRSRSVSLRLAPRLASGHSATLSNGLATIEECLNTNDGNVVDKAAAGRICRVKSRSCTENELLGWRESIHPPAPQPPRLLLNDVSFGDERLTSPPFDPPIILPMSL